VSFIGRPRVYDTVEEFTQAIVDYFTDIEKENELSLETTGRLKRVPNMASLCNYMGIVKDTFYNYAKRVDSKNQPFSDSTKRAAQYMEGFKLEGAALGLLKEISIIFDLKNNHGYADKIEVNTKSDNEQLTPDDIKAELNELRKKQESQQSTDTNEL
jgi:hypothetical protein